jgi:hypothetical protein
MRSKKLFKLTSLSLFLGLGACAASDVVDDPAGSEADSLSSTLATWSNVGFAAQTGTFTAELDAVPSSADQDVVVGLSRGAAGAYTDLAAIVRFGVNRQIDVRNGATYASLAPIPNVAGRSYHVRMLVDIPAKRYSVWITPAGQTEVRLARDYAFRDSQSTVTSLANRTKFNLTGNVRITNFTLSGGGGGGGCTPTTCAAAGKNCGTISNGCSGSLDCGGCSAPSTCGGGGTANVCGTPTMAGFPDATNTGVPPGTVLTSSGPLTVTTPGTVISGRSFSGTVDIAANNVTLQKCKVSSGGWWAVRIRDGVTGTIVQDCEIDNQSVGGQGIHGAGTFLRNNIHHCADGIDVPGDNTLIQDNYIHDMAGTPDSHFDTIQADGSYSNLTIRHNTLVNEHSQTGVLMIDDYWGPIHDVLVENNRLLGGGYTIYAGSWNGYEVTGVRIRNNRLKKGYWGYLSRGTGDVTFSGNVDDATGAAVNLQ